MGREQEIEKTKRSLCKWPRTQRIFLQQRPNTETESTKVKIKEIIFMGTDTSDRVPPALGCLSDLRVHGEVCGYSLTEAGRNNMLRNGLLLAYFNSPAYGNGVRLQNVLIDLWKGISSKHKWYFYDQQNEPELNDLQQSKGEIVDISFSDEGLETVRKSSIPCQHKQSYWQWLWMPCAFRIIELAETTEEVSTADLIEATLDCNERRRPYYNLWSWDFFVSDS